MNRKKTMLIKLVSKTSSFFYTTIIRKQQNRKKFLFKKYDPYLRKRSVFLEQKIT